MADYYPVIARAVLGLSDDTAQARRELYHRARAIVIEQLRRRDPDELMPETAQERAALEAAIRRVEAESQPARTRADSRPQQPGQPDRRAAPSRRPSAQPPHQPAAAQPKTAVNYLAKILHALQPSEAVRPAPPKPARGKPNETGDAVAVQPKATADDLDPPQPEDGGELGGMLHSLGTMMLALTYCVAALACIGVVYFRGSVMIAAGIIGYPVFLLMVAVVLGLFVVAPWAFFRKTSILPTIGFLLRAIHSASRQSASRQAS